MSPYDLIELARRLFDEVDEILPPVALLEALDAAVTRDVRVDVIGHTARGTPLRRYRFGAGQHAVLLYGFPDPGEAVGGTVILTLLRAWLRREPDLRALDVTWHCVPVVNPDDQPDGGRTLPPVRKTAAQEVDWWGEAGPRPEARAILALAERLRPLLTMPLHDEFHARRPVPAYLPISHVFGGGFAGHVAQLLALARHPLSDTLSCPLMGPGFAAMPTLAGPAWPRSTFAGLAEHGPVLICEVAAHPGLRAGHLVMAQLGVLLLGVLHVQRHGPLVPQTQVAEWGPRLAQVGHADAVTLAKVWPGPYADVRHQEVVMVDEVPGTPWFVALERALQVFGVADTLDEALALLGDGPLGPCVDTERQRRLVATVACQAEGGISFGLSPPLHREGLRALWTADGAPDETVARLRGEAERLDQYATDVSFPDPDSAANARALAMHLREIVRQIAGHDAERGAGAERGATHIVERDG